MIQSIIEGKLLKKLGLESGKTLFRNYMPATCTIGVMTKLPLTGVKIDPNIPGRYKSTVQLITRHKDPNEGETLAESVQSALELRTSREFYASTETNLEMHLDMFIPQTLPIFYPRMNGNGYEWSQEFSFVLGVKSAS